MEDAMATTLVEPFTPWMRELGQVLHNQGTVGAFVPPADLLIDDDGVTVYMDVPGLRAENIQIELENDVLTVSGERPFPYAREDGSGPARRVERGFGRFQRILRVPPGLNPDAIEASIADGVLRLRIPKPESLRPRRIEIRADADGAGQEAGTTA
jgi:HSP20 family protein